MDRPVSDYRLSAVPAELSEDYAGNPLGTFIAEDRFSEDYSYQNAAACPDCGAGMVRQGLCFACPACGFGSCGS